jgi:glycosyltransferase involved in cell wall biosynthesis
MPKRVAYLINQYPMVSHTFIRREIAAVEQSGKVTVSRFSLRQGALGFVDPADREEAAKTRVVLDQGVASLLFACLRTALARPRRFLEALALTIRTGVGSDRGLLRNFVYLAEACALLGPFRDAGVEHVHAHFGTNATAVAMLCRVLGGPPYSFTVHGPLEFDLGPTLALPEKIARAEFVAAITSFCRSQVFRNCGSEQWHKVHVVPCGVDSSFLAEPPAPIPSAPRLVFVGRLSDHKAPGLLVEAVSRLARRGIACELTFAGDGELRAEIESAIARNGLSGRARVLGFADEATVRKHISESRALVLPSFGEGLPVVIMEAFALGRPVVSTYVAGIPELVESGVNGWLVPASSLAELERALQEVLEAPVERLEAMGRDGRARVAAGYDVAKSGALLVALFTGGAAASSRPPRSPTS